MSECPSMIAMLDRHFLQTAMPGFTRMRQGLQGVEKACRLMLAELACPPDLHRALTEISLLIDLPSKALAPVSPAFFQSDAATDPVAIHRTTIAALQAAEDVAIIAEASIKPFLSDFPRKTLPDFFAMGHDALGRHMDHLRYGNKLMLAERPNIYGGPVPIRTCEDDPSACTCSISRDKMTRISRPEGLPHLQSQ